MGLEVLPGWRGWPVPPGEGDGRLQGGAPLCVRGSGEPSRGLTASRRLRGPGALSLQNSRDGQGRAWQDGLEEPRCWDQRRPRPRGSGAVPTGRSEKDLGLCLSAPPPREPVSEPKH